jgi:exosome complex RNA-binding protein Csl4
VSLVGKDIIAECTKCKLSLAHVVIYEVEGKVKKVKCKTCGTEHVYKGAAKRKKEINPAISGQDKKPKTTTKRIKTVYDADLDWELKHREMNQEITIKDYHMQDTYKPGDVVKHPLFGLGFVRQVSGTSMEVLFKDSLKRMAKSVKISGPGNVIPTPPALRMDATVS